MSIPSTGRVYGDKENTPVPFPGFRCKSTAKGVGKTLTHLCKVTVDHAGNHRCICGKTWKNTAEVQS